MKLIGRTVLLITIAVALAGIVLPASGGEIANSVKGFSSTQGANGWYYGYCLATDTYNPNTDFQLLPNYGNAPPKDAIYTGWYLSENSWLSIRKTAQHPNDGGVQGGDPLNKWSIRRWQSNIDGTIVVTGTVQRAVAAGAPYGTEFSVVIDGVVDYSVTLTDTTAISYSSQSQIHNCSSVDFLVKALGGYDGVDTTLDSASILSLAILNVTPVTDTTSSVTSATATLNGHVASSSGYSNAHFDWGTTSSYGNTVTATKSSSSNGNDYCVASLTGLSPNTAYHYRFAATISGTATYGSDQSFTTGTAQYVLAIQSASGTGAGRTTAFVSTQIGNTSDQTLTITNVSSSTIIGSANVGIGPFRIVGGISYVLTAGQSKTITVRFTPTKAGYFNPYVTFTTGHGNVVWQVTGTGFVNPLPNFGSISGQAILVSSTTTVGGILVTAGGQHASTSNADGSYQFTGLAAGSYDVSFATTQGYPLGVISNVPVTAGLATQLDIPVDYSVLNDVTGPTLQREEIPVVLVRGLGKDKSWITFDPTSEFSYFESIRDDFGYAFPLFTNVWDCNEPDNDPYFPVYNGAGHVINGEHTIEVNADRLSYFIGQKAQQYMRLHGYYPSSINIVAHSMGGLITRHAIVTSGTANAIEFQDTQGHTQHINVGKVVMLATPNAGSLLSDYASQHKYDLDVIAYALGAIPYADSTKELETHKIIYAFNPHHQWPGSVGLYLLGCQGGPSSLSSDLKWGSKFIIRETPIPEEQTNDGAVQLPSVSGKYHTMKVTESISIVTNYESFPTSNPILNRVDNEVAGGLLDHYTLLNSESVIQWVRNILLDNPEQLSPVTTARALTLSANTTSPLPKPVQQMLSTSGTIAASSTLQVQFKADAASSLHVTLTTGSSNIALRLVDSTAHNFTSTSPATDPNVQYTKTTDPASGVTQIEFVIASPVTGAWSAIIDGSAIATGNVSYELDVSGDSSVALLPETAPLAKQGDAIVVSCHVADLATNPITHVASATPSAKVTFPDGTTTTLALFDDGLHNDGAPGDGLFGAVLTSSTQAGSYLVAYNTTGVTNDGMAFQRVATGSFDVAPADANISGNLTNDFMDVDGNGMADYLRLGCWITPHVAGSYVVSAELVNTAGDLRVSAVTTLVSTGSATTTVNLLFDLHSINNAGAGGDFHIENLQLFEEKSSGSAWLDDYQQTTVIHIGPSITAAPQNQTSEEGTFATFSVTATGGTNTYQWKYNGANIPGATQATLSLTPLTHPAATRSL